MKGYVDKDICIGCGICTGVCAEVFAMDDDGKAKAADLEITEDIIESAKDAEAQCPVSAITVK